MWTARDLNDLIYRYADALQRDDFKEARKLLLLARGAVICMPDATGANGERIRYHRGCIDDMLTHLERLEVGVRATCVPIHMRDDRGAPTERGWTGDQPVQQSSMISVLLLLAAIIAAAASVWAAT